MPDDFSKPDDAWHLEDVEEADQYPNGCFTLRYTAPPGTPPTEAEAFGALGEQISRFAKRLGPSADPPRPKHEWTNEICRQELGRLRGK